MRHVMLDLETWGTKPGCALRSIGAVSFAPEKAVDYSQSSFYLNIDEASCLEVGLEKERSTVEWWLKQSLESRAALLVKPCLLRNAVLSFHEWFRSNQAEYIWCHGANFDEPIWVAAANAVGERTPWKFWNVRCTRTIYHAADFDPRSIPREGTYHNALDDARYQARCVIAAAQKLKAWRYGPPAPIVTHRDPAPHMTSEAPPQAQAELAPNPESTPSA